MSFVPSVGDGALTADDSVSLRRIGEDDLGMLYDIASAAPQSWLRLCSEGLPNPHQFSDALWEGVLYQAIVLVEGLPLGIAAVYRPSFIHGTAWLEVVGAETHPPARHLIERGGQLVVEHVFQRWPIRKLYSQHGAYEGPRVQRWDGFSVIEEARLPNALYHDRIVWDLVIEAVYAGSQP